jgi:hypothetical protein
LHDLKVGDVFRTTGEGNVQVVNIVNTKNISVIFLSTGSVVQGFTKDAILNGFVSDRAKKQAARENKQQIKDSREQARAASLQSKLERLEQAKLRTALRQQELVSKREAEQQKKEAHKKALEDSATEMRKNAITALQNVELLEDWRENPNDVNVDFKDREGNWVLRFSMQGRFVQTRLGRLHNNMTQREGRNNSCYRDVLVSDEFKDAQKFCDWVVNQDGWGCGHSLDKDLLAKGNRIYGAQTCCFLPQVINTAIARWSGKSNVQKTAEGWSVKFIKNRLKIFLGVYSSEESAKNAIREYRKSYVTRLADFYKCKLSERAYSALLEWTPE